MSRQSCVAGIESSLSSCQTQSVCCELPQSTPTVNDADID